MGRITGRRRPGYRLELSHRRRKSVQLDVSQVLKLIDGFRTLSPSCGRQKNTQHSSSPTCPDSDQQKSILNHSRKHLQTLNYKTRAVVMKVERARLRQVRPPADVVPAMTTDRVRDAAG